MKEILEYIARLIKEESNCFDSFFTLAQKDEEGRVLLRVGNVNEFKFVGLNDIERNYFYFRIGDESTIQYIDQDTTRRLASCSPDYVEQRVPLRLVAVVYRKDPFELESELRRLLMSIEIPGNENANGIRISLKSSVLDSFQVMKEESPKMKKFDKNLIFVAIDFDLVSFINSKY